MRMALVTGMVAVFAVQAVPAGADQRAYVWTYEYNTMERGKAELEHYLTFSGGGAGGPGATATKQQVEVEVGMTSRFDVGVYQVFAQKAGEGLAWDGFKVRPRYRFAERGAWPVDVLLYGEYASSADLLVPAFEFKLILARDWGKLNLSLNPQVEYERDGEWENETSLVGGASWKVYELLTAGCEVRIGEEETWVGPTIAHGNSSFWMSLGLSFRTVRPAGERQAFEARLITGLEL